MQVGDQPIEVMVTKKAVMHGTNEDPRLLATESVATTQANVYNVSKFVEDTKYYKEKMKQIKETLVRERTKVKQLNRKYVDILS